MPDKELTQVQTVAEELLADLKIEGSVVVERAGDENTFSVQIESPHAHLLIGFHGETLQSFQLILSLAVHRALARWSRVLVNVGDYRQRREEQLRDLALSLTQRAVFSQEAQTITGLSAGERRLIHLTLADHPEVETVSEGEGRERVLLVRPKTKEL